MNSKHSTPLPKNLKRSRESYKKALICQNYKIVLVLNMTRLRNLTIMKIYLSKSFLNFWIFHHSKVYLALKTLYICAKLLKVQMSCLNWVDLLLHIYIYTWTDWKSRLLQIQGSRNESSYTTLNWDTALCLLYLHPRIITLLCSGKIF